MRHGSRRARGRRALRPRRAAARAPPGRSPAALRRVGRRDRPRVHARQRRDRPVLHAGDDGRRRGAVRLRQRRRSRRLSRPGRAARRDASPRAAAADSRLFRNDLTVDADGKPHAPLHGRHRAGRRRAARPTAWAPPSATTTTTATWISSSPASGRTTLLSQQRRRHVHRRDAAGRRDDDPLWSTSAAFVDYDRDGDLDLFVANYVDFTVAGQQAVHRSRRRARLLRAALVPAGARPSVPQRRQRPLRRRHRARRASAKADGAGLGVAVGDYNGDGWLGSLRRQRRDAEPTLDQPARRHVRRRRAALGRRAERRRAIPKAAWASPRATSIATATRISFVTNIVGETSALYVNDGHGNFEDARARSRAGAADGGVHRLRHRLVRLRQRRLARSLRRQRRRQHHRGAARPAVAVPDAQPAVSQPGNGTLRRDQRAQAGPAFARAEISRGAAFGDIDNDGDVDIVVTNNNGARPPVAQPGRHTSHWLQVRLDNSPQNRLALGALVHVERPGAPPLVELSAYR